LERTDRDAQGDKTKEVECLAVSAAGLADEDQNAEAGDDPDR
jgi:hypothetical protein